MPGLQRSPHAFVETWRGILRKPRSERLQLARGVGLALQANASAASCQARVLPAVATTSHGFQIEHSLTFSDIERSGLMLNSFSHETTRCPSDSTPALAGSELLVGNSESMQKIKAYLVRLSRTSSNVLVTGETGTGKELIAQLIHRNSWRRDNPLVCINCAAIPDTLLESELFGYERGAFTGAYASRNGNLKEADGGTLFLDEIGDMSPYAQAKVLRAIETGEVQRLGSNKTQHIDIRIVAATNRDLERLSQDERFRSDLFFRLNVARIHIPPLRERPEDILPLAEHFREQFNRLFGRATTAFTDRSLQALFQHRWPGNVRELKDMVEAAFINSDPETPLLEMPELFCRAVQGSGRKAISEMDLILNALSTTHWNKSRAAEILHWSRMTLYRKMERYGIAEDNQLENSNEIQPVLS